MKMLARRTLDAVTERDQAMFDVVIAAYANGVLPFGMLGLQCVGYKTDFDEPLRAWATRNAKPLQSGGSGRAAGAPTRPPRTEVGRQVAAPASPQLGGDNGNPGSTNAVGATEHNEAASAPAAAKPKKRRSDGATTIDPRKKSRKVTELIVEPVPAGAGEGVKCEEVAGGAPEGAAVKTERD